MYQAIFATIAILSLFLGVFIFFHPASAIEIQRRFYLTINWKIEPVSMSKEIHNTRIMGFSLIFISFLLLLYLVL